MKRSNQIAFCLGAVFAVISVAINVASLLGKASHSVKAFGTPCLSFALVLLVVGFSTASLAKKQK